MRTRPLNAREEQTTMSNLLRLVVLLTLHATWLSSVAGRFPVEGDLRLVHSNPRLRSCGRVEVFYNGTWGTVCDNSWHKRDADVVCRQLGFAEGSRFRCHAACFGEGEGKIWMDELACPRGGDKVMLCDFKEWGEHDCTHANDVGVCCKGEQSILAPLSPTDETRVRISCPCAADECRSCPQRLGPSPPSPTEDCSAPSAALEGMVEVSFGEKWLPVTAGAWSPAAASVACGELGYPLALATSSYFPNDACTAEETLRLKESSDIASNVVTSVQCSGNETMLRNCTLRTGPGSSSFCAAKLVCGFLIHPDCPDSNVTHRLRAGARPWMGRVEVKIDGKWGTVSDRNFGMRDANVACRAAGFGTAVSVQNGSQYGRGIGQVHHHNLWCVGNESSLSECSSTPGTEDLDHSGDVGVVCHSPTPCSPIMRLVPAGGQESEGQGTRSGYIELSGSQGPGLLCAGVLDAPSARVACASTSTMFLQNMTRVAPPNSTTDEVLYYRGRVECTGDEADITECSVDVESVEAVTECPWGLVQQLTCTSCVPDLVPDLDSFRSSLTRHSSPLTSYFPAIVYTPMVYLACALEENCLSSSAYSASGHDRRTLLKFESFTNNWGLCPFLPNLDRSDWIFHDCHNHYHSFEAFVDFNLVDPATGEKVAEGHKASFCLEDTVCAEGYSVQYQCRPDSEQGISANCGDRYGRYLDCQWIDITGVSSGTYLVSQLLNPHRDTSESDFRNNEVTCKVELIVEDSTVNVIECWQSDHT